MNPNKKRPWGKIAPVFAALGLALALAACTNPADDNRTEPNERGASVSGRVRFSGQESRGTITVFLERTDGLNVRQSRSANAVRAVSQGARSTVAGPDGSYSFANVPPGVYTVFAVWGNENAILVNIPVESDSPTVNPEMVLRPPGEITGRIMLDGSENNNLGFTVFVAGTSFIAITNHAGRFTIPSVPANAPLQIAVTRGAFAGIWTDATVESGATLDLGNFRLTSAQLTGDSIQWQGALSSPPENPQRNWSYFNTTTRRTYVFDGTRWIVVGQVLTLGSVEYRGNGHTGGTPPVDANPDGGYVIGATVFVMEPGDLEKEGYRFGGWSRELGGGERIYQPGETFIMGAEPVVFYAVWLRLVTVTFVSERHDVKIPESLQGIAGEELPLPLLPYYDMMTTGIFFYGWNIPSDAAETVYRDYFVVGNEDVVLHAIWANVFDFSDGTITRFNIRERWIWGITLPSTIDGIPVVAIGQEAFLGAWLSFVGIPHGVVRIEDSAFHWASIQSVDIPGSVVSIGANAFAGTMLTSVEIPEGVVYIGEAAFALGRLTSVVIPEGVTHIERWVFERNQLTSVTIPDSVTRIERGAFSRNQLTSVTIPNSVTYIGNDAFANNLLESVEILANIAEIRDAAFAQNRLTSIVIPVSVSAIRDSAFWDNALTSITIPGDVGIEMNSMGIHHASFSEFYFANGRRAGTYTLNTATEAWTFEY